MDAIVSTAVAAAGTVAGYAGQRALDLAVDKFAAAIIRPCAERRAHAYFRQLAAAVAQVGGIDEDPERIARALDEVTKHDSARETVFEYYRQSVLSRSREWGPRVLALIAARLIAANRTPSAEENQASDIAEICTDEDFTEFKDFFESLPDGKYVRNGATIKLDGSEYVIKLRGESFGSSDIDTAPLNLSMELGSWATKFERVTAIEQTVSMSISYEEPREFGEKHIKSAVYRSIIFRDACRLIYDLLAFAKLK